MSFNIKHNEAFRSVGAKEPGLHWSSFDVERHEAYAGNALFFVTTCWNWHHAVDDKKKKTPTHIGIYRDGKTGKFWYQYKAPNSERPSSTHLAHWKSLNYALDNRLPIIALFKDYKSTLCDDELIFDVTDSHLIADTDIWICLEPNNDTDFECALIDNIENIFSNKIIIESSEYNSSILNDAVAKSLLLTDDELRNKLEIASKKPQRKVVTTYIFERNPDVVAAALRRANGRCEKCDSIAPFIRKSDQTPYLEVHHLIRLADGGDDSVENTIAICPNCHRKYHFG